MLLRVPLAREHALLPLCEQGLSRVRGEARAVRDAAGAGDPADVFRALAEVPTCRTGSLRRAAADLAHRLRTAREILRSAAVLVSAAGRRARAERRRRRARTQYQRRLSAARDHPAADDDVPLMGFAERVATADPVRELPVHEPRYSHGA